MAKKVGSENASPPPSAGSVLGHNQPVVTPESYLTAVKEITAQRAKVKAENELLVSIRKKHKANGIELGVLDSMVKMAAWARAEIRDHFAIQARYAEWLGLPVAPSTLKQAEMFQGMDDHQIQKAEWYSAGVTASRTGKVGRPPDECAPEFHQDFMRGFNGADEDAWNDTEDPGPAIEPIAPVTKPEPAGGDFSAAENADGPHSTEALDHGQPSWEGFDVDPGKWGEVQEDQFVTWFESLPRTALVLVSHPGVAIAFEQEVAELKKQGVPFPAQAQAPVVPDAEESGALTGGKKAGGKKPTSKDLH
jgi:hypothetical protein